MPFFYGAMLLVLRLIAREKAGGGKLGQKLDVLGVIAGDLLFLPPALNAGNDATRLIQQETKKSDKRPCHVIYNVKNRGFDGKNHIFRSVDNQLPYRHKIDRKTSKDGDYNKAAKLAVVMVKQQDGCGGTHCETKQNVLYTKKNVEENCNKQRPALFFAQHFSAFHCLPLRFS